MWQIFDEQKRKWRRVKAKNESHIFAKTTIPPKRTRIDWSEAGGGRRVVKAKVLESVTNLENTSCAYLFEYNLKQYFARNVKKTYLNWEKLNWENCVWWWPFSFFIRGLSTVLPQFTSVCTALPCNSWVASKIWRVLSMRSCNFALAFLSRNSFFSVRHFLHPETEKTHFLLFSDRSRGGCGGCGDEERKKKPTPSSPR